MPIPLPPISVRCQTLDGSSTNAHVPSSARFVTVFLFFWVQAHKFPASTRGLPWRKQRHKHFSQSVLQAGSRSWRLVSSQNRAKRHPCHCGTTPERVCGLRTLDSQTRQQTLSQHYFITAFSAKDKSYHRQKTGYDSPRTGVSLAAATMITHHACGWFTERGGLHRSFTDKPMDHFLVESHAANVAARDRKYGPLTR